MKTVFYEWSSEDVKTIAENMEIELSNDDINDICEELEGSLNNWDTLNEMISCEIYNIIAERKEKV